MTKHCAECGEIHEQRGFFCTPACRRDFRNRKRAEKAGKRCRLCGRVFPHPRIKQEQRDGVPREHTYIEGEIGNGISQETFNSPDASPSLSNEAAECS